MARDYKREYQLQKLRGEHPNRMKRQKARRELDRKGVNRTGKDIDHKIPLSKGGGNGKKNIRLVSKKTNRSKKDKVIT